MNRQVLNRLIKAKMELDEMLLKMDQDESCIEVILQSKKVQKLLREADQILVRCHLNQSVNKLVGTSFSDTDIKEIVKGFKAL